MVFRAALIAARQLVSEYAQRGVPSLSDAAVWVLEAVVGWAQCYRGTACSFGVSARQELVG